jgi:urease accessory protein
MISGATASESAVVASRTIIGGEVYWSERRMWCESIVRNAREGEDLGGRAVDYVDIQWDQCRSTLKARSRGGEEVRVLLPRGQTLRHGDVLFEDDRHAVVVNVLPCEVVVVRSPESRLMAELALELGNLHQPTQVGENELAFLEDPQALAAAQRLGLEVTRELRRFEPLAVLVAMVRPAQRIQILRPGNRPADQ